MSFPNFSLKGAVIKCNQILISICKKKNEGEGGGGACGPLNFDNSFNRNTGLNVEEMEKGTAS